MAFLGPLVVGISNDDRDIDRVALYAVKKD